MRTPTASWIAFRIAAAVGTSVYHLCRVFRAHTGLTMHAYRTALRLRLSLESLGCTKAPPTLSALAFELGFASHSHFVTAMRRHLGQPPSGVRAALTNVRD